jgi:hypothetical protein
MPTKRRLKNRFGEGKIMEICKNKKTGQTFIYLHEDESDRAVMITPQGSVKALDTELFTEPFEVEMVKELLGQGKINGAQYRIYCQYAQS